MATKTISLHLAAYERLRAARRREDESLGTTGTDLLDHLSEVGATFRHDELDVMSALDDSDMPIEDKWRS